MHVNLREEKYSRTSTTATQGTKFTGRCSEMAIMGR